MSEILSDRSKLHTINNLLGSTTGADPDRISAIRSAINFADDDELLETTEAQIIDFHLSHASELGFKHIALKGESYDPLWIREEILSGLRKLAGYEEAMDPLGTTLSQLVFLHLILVVKRELNQCTSQEPNGQKIKK